MLSARLRFADLAKSGNMGSGLGGDSYSVSHRAFASLVDHSSQLFQSSGQGDTYGGVSASLAL